MLGIVPESDIICLSIIKVEACCVNCPAAYIFYPSLKLGRGWGVIEAWLFDGRCDKKKVACKNRCGSGNEGGCVKFEF